MKEYNKKKDQGVARCADITFPHHHVGVIIISHKLRPPQRLPSDVKIGFSLGNLFNLSKLISDTINQWKKHIYQLADHFEESGI